MDKLHCEVVPYICLHRTAVNFLLAVLIFIHGTEFHNICKCSELTISIKNKRKSLPSQLRKTTHPKALLTNMGTTDKLQECEIKRS